MKNKANSIIMGVKIKRKVEHGGKSRTNTFILLIVLGAVLVGFILFVPESLLFILWFITGSDGSSDVQHAPTNNYVPEKSTPYPFPGPDSDQMNYTNSIGMDFVLIPAGEFDMGSPSDEWERYGREGPVHKINIPYGFYLGNYEVTQKQWHEVMGDGTFFFQG